MNKKLGKIIIIGAGITGLGASWRFLEKEKSGHQYDWTILEKTKEIGGNAFSYINNGFTWDIGSHVIYSHYKYFNNVLNSIMDEDEWQFNERAGWVWMFNKFIPYPIQRNIRHFPQEIMSSCIKELSDILSDNSKTFPPPNNLEEWLRNNYGNTLVNKFFSPFNFKMWAHPINQLSCSWVEMRAGSKNKTIPQVNLEKLIQNIKNNDDDPGWTPDDKFPYPKTGGFGKITKRIGDRIPSKHIKYGYTVKNIKSLKKELELSNGESIPYDYLLSTMPLPNLLSIISDQPRIRELGTQLKFASAHIVGVAYEGKLPTNLENKYWLYFPQLDLPFFRVSILSNYSRNNVPNPLMNWSLLCEVSTSEFRELDTNNLIENVISGLYRSIVPRNAKVIDHWQKSLRIGYPVPSLNRDSILSEIQLELHSNQIFSRGRLGGMKYESSNTDYAFMQGVEVVDFITEGKNEVSYHTPELIEF